MPFTQLFAWRWDNLHDLTWHPEFTAAQAFAIPGLLGAVVAVALYLRLIKADTTQQLVEDVMEDADTGATAYNNEIYGTDNGGFRY